MLSVQFKLQEGAPLSKSREVGESIREYFMQHEAHNVDLVMIRYGRNFSGTGQNLGQGFIALKHWDERQGQQHTAQAIRERAMQHFRQHPNAQITIGMPAAVRGLGKPMA